MIEMGPGAGSSGGQVIAQGTLEDIGRSPDSKIGPFLAGRAGVSARKRAAESEMFEYGRIHISTAAIHTVKPLEVDIPKGRLTVVTGVSGSGKTTLILESDIREFSAGSAGDGFGRQDAGSRAGCTGRRHPARQADRRDTHRHQYPLYRSYIR